MRIRPASFLAFALFFGGCGDASLAIGGDPDMRQPREPIVHRAVASACTSARPPYSGPGDLYPNQSYVKCRSDADCTEGTNGRCTGDPHDGWGCTYDQCTTDAECPTGTLCDCRSPWRKGSAAGDGPTRCLPTDCRTDADCGVSGYCSPSFDSCGAYSGVVRWACHTAKDTCVTDADCADVDGGTSFGYAPYCAYRQEIGAWTCLASQCAG